MKAHKTLILIIVLTTCLTQLASDIYMPSLTTIASQFKIAISLVQLSMPIYLIGVAVTELIYGPLSEGLGRKLILLFGFCLMLVGSLVCTMANSITVLLIGRFIQGSGAGACAALFRTIIRDVFSGIELAKVGSYLTTIIMFVIPTAPAFGGWLHDHLGWRSSFWFMVIYSLFSLLLVLFAFQETNRDIQKSKLKLTYVIKSYQELLSNRIFFTTTLSTFFCYGAYFSWFVVGPVIMVQELHLSASEFGCLTCLTLGTSYGAAGYLNAKLVPKWGIQLMIRVGFSIMLFAGASLLLGNILFGNQILLILLPVTLFYFGSTLFWSNAFARAFTPFGHIAGYAGSLYGFLQLSGGAVIGSLVSYLPTSSIIPMAVVVLANVFIASLITEWSYANASEN